MQKKREVHSNTCLPKQEKFKKKSNFIPKGNRKRKPKISRSKEIINLRVKINKIESKKIDKMNQTKSRFFAKISKMKKPLVKFTEKKENSYK